MCTGDDPRRLCVSCALRCGRRVCGTRKSELVIMLGLTIIASLLAAHCQPWCESPCSELTGDPTSIHDECGGCDDTTAVCHPQADDYPLVTVVADALGDNQVVNVKESLSEPGGGPYNDNDSDDDDPDEVVDDEGMRELVKRCSELAESIMAYQHNISVASRHDVAEHGRVSHPEPNLLALSVGTWRWSAESRYHEPLAELYAQANRVAASAPTEWPRRLGRACAPVHSLIDGTMADLPELRVIGARLRLQPLRVRERHRRMLWKDVSRAADINLDLVAGGRLDLAADLRDALAEWTPALPPHVLGDGGIHKRWHHSGYPAVCPALQHVKLTQAGEEVDKMLPEGVGASLRESWEAIAADARQVNFEGDAWPNIIQGETWQKLVIYTNNMGWSVESCKVMPTVCALLRGRLRTEVPGVMFQPGKKGWRTLAGADEEVTLFKLKPRSVVPLHAGTAIRVNTQLCLLNCEGAHLEAGDAREPYKPGHLVSFSDDALHGAENCAEHTSRVMLTVGTLHPELTPEHRPCPEAEAQ
jgi:hypothetical protein